MVLEISKTKDKLEYSKSEASESDVVKMMHVYDIKPRMKYAPQVEVEAVSISNA
jgi:hypothetical protein